MERMKELLLEMQHETSFVITTIVDNWPQYLPSEHQEDIVVCCVHECAILGKTCLGIL